MKNAKELSRDFLHFVLPKNCFGDYLFGLYSFINANEYYPNMKYPRRFMEHMLHMKRCGELYDPLRQLTSDKFRLKQFVASILGARYSPRTYHLLRTEEDVARLALRRFPCVIKPTHSSGDVVIVNGGHDAVDKEKIARWLKIDLYRQFREANYRYLKPAIIVEELIADASGSVSNDYKVYCVDGAPKFIQVDKDRFTSHVRNYYNTDWEHLPFTAEDRPIGPAERRPEALGEMLRVARTLAGYFSGYVRVDLLYSGSEIKVVELDHSSANCKMRPRPIEYDWLIGELFTNPGKLLKPVQPPCVLGDIDAAYPGPEVYTLRRARAAR